jgi:superfamily II DNA or RNA helicase
MPRIPFDIDTATKALTECLGFTPYKDQVLALQHLYNGNDHILVAPCGRGKTIVITGLACILSKPEQTITLIISPLKQGSRKRVSFDI